MRSPQLRRMFSSGRYRKSRLRASRVLAATTVFALSAMGVVFAGPVASAATHTVEQRNFQFVPGTLSIATGDTVTWTNNETDGSVHSVVQSGGSEINSPDIPPGGSFSHTFNNPGEYRLTCRFHPDMFMTVSVGGGGTPPPTSTQPTTTPPPTSSTTAPPSTTQPPSSSTQPPSSTQSPTSSPTGTQTGEPEVPSGPGGAPIGVGPLPISFDLTDDNGAWFDTNLNLFGTRSLAVAELPRVNLGSLLGSAGLLDLNNLPLLGDGGLLGGSLGSVLNTGMPQLESLLPADVGGLGDLGVDPAQLLNLDKLLGTVNEILPVGDPRIGQVNDLVGQLLEQLAELPADLPVSLEDLPVGVELQGLLENLITWASNDISLPVTVNFNVAKPSAESAHTATSLIWPEGAKGFPFDQGGAWVGTQSVQLTEPGLYAFACKIHPYMLGAVVVDDPLTPGLDFGKKLRVNSRNLSVPSNADVVMQLVQKFFNITAPSNWQQFSDTEEKLWNPSYPPVPILTYDEEGKPQLIPVLDLFLKQKFDTPKTLPALGKKPAVPGVGEVWIDTQKEEYAEKSKVGSATKVNTETWTIDRKVSLPGIDMNNPHNMWTDKDEKYIYQTEWFDDQLNVIDRKSGELVRQIEVGPDPSHVMTRTDTDQVLVAINGGAAVMELSPGATKIDRRLATQEPGSKIAHPHGFWTAGDASVTMTPNVNTYNSSIIDLQTGQLRQERTGELPIAVGMDAENKTAYVADFLGGTVSCISLTAQDMCDDGGTKTHYKSIDLWANYDPVKGGTGPFGGLPIQIPVAPDNSAVLVANTLTSNITVIDPKTDETVKYLPCDAGCHGINFGAKKGGGYYAYVASKFSNAMTIVDTDPNGDGDPSDAKIAGKFVLDSQENTQTDGEITKFDGFGGMGVLPIPLVYNGWVQNVPDNAVNSQLTCRQRNPVDYGSKCS